MAQTQIADVVVPAEFTAYQVENSLVSTALFQSGVAVRNGEMASQPGAGAEQFSGTVDESGAICPFDAARDMEALREAISRIGGISLLIIDPIVTAVTGDMHKANDVRRSCPLLEQETWSAGSSRAVSTFMLRSRLPPSCPMAECRLRALCDKR
jgi:hypothetical protein